MNGQQSLYMHRHHHSLVALIAGLATLAATMAMAIPAASADDGKTTDQQRANDQNTMKGVGIGAGALGLWELLHGRGTNALILGAGAAYAGKKYEDERKARQEDEKRREEEQREHDRRVGEMKRREESGSASSASLPPPTANTFSPIHVLVNDDPVSFAGKGPEMSAGSVYVPMRGVLEKLGAYVEWDSVNHEVIARKGEKVVTLPMKSSRATVNGQETALDTPAYLSAGSTMVPLRFLAQTFGAKVDWDARDREVKISSPTSFANSPG